MQQPVEPTLEQRRIPFHFPDDLDPVWIPENPELSAMVNGGSLVMPYLEPFLIRTLREASALIRDDALRIQAAGFNAQEGQHFRTHRRFNDVLKAVRYPELSEIEDAMTQSYARLDRRPLRTRMAYTAGFESMTMGLTRWLVESRCRLFRGADSTVTSFVLWHMVEETEHKRVAYDVYQHLFGGSLSGYWARMIGVFHGSLDALRFSMRGYKQILKKEGRWQQPGPRLRLAKNISDFVIHVAPYLLRAALPGHNPRSEKDPQWVKDWLAGYARSDDGHVPLVDTLSRSMPIPFPALQGPASADTSARIASH